jgi:hypothetical protein
LLYQPSDIGEFDTPGKEQLNGNLIGRTDDRRPGSSPLPRFDSQPEAGEGIEVGLLESQLAKARPFKAR